MRSFARCSTSASLAAVEQRLHRDHTLIGTVRTHLGRIEEGEIEAAEKVDLLVAAFGEIHPFRIGGIGARAPHDLDQPIRIDIERRLRKEVAINRERHGMAACARFLSVQAARLHRILPHDALWQQAGIEHMRTGLDQLLADRRGAGRHGRIAREIERHACLLVAADLVRQFGKRGVLSGVDEQDVDDDRAGFQRQKGIERARLCAIAPRPGHLHPAQGLVVDEGHRDLPAAGLGIDIGPGDQQVGDVLRVALDQVAEPERVHDDLVGREDEEEDRHPPERRLHAQPLDGLLVGPARAMDGARHAPARQLCCLIPHATPL